MKRFSIYFLYGISVLTAAFLYDYYANIADWKSFYDKWWVLKVDRLDSEALVARSFLEARGDEGQLADFLEGRRRSGGVDYWVLYRDGKLVDTSFRPEDLQSDRQGIPFDLEAPGQNIIALNPTNHYAVEKLESSRGKEAIVVGTQYNQERFLTDNLAERKMVIIRYCLGAFAVSLAIFAFLFRDFMKSITTLAKGGRRFYASTGPRSREADQLIRGLSSYEGKNTELKKEKEMFIWQVLPSLRTELMSGRKPPYTFGCTLVRTDINNFSKIYNEYPVEEFAATISEFFIEVSHVVARYNGLVHEFVGDEVIYYFKDEDTGNSAMAAISAVRDINQIAHSFHQKMLSERGYPFTVKSAISNGKLRFGRFVNGYGIAGPALIESVRIVSLVNEKDGNVVVFDSRHLAALKKVVEAKFYLETKLKGFPDERRLYSYVRHQSLGELIAREEDHEFLRYYRSDEDLTEIIAWARANTQKQGGIDRVLRMIGILRQIPVTRSNGVPPRVLIEWLGELLENIENLGTQAPDGVLRVLASVVRLTENLIPSSEFTNEHEAVLRRALEIQDRRVVANALDALTLFRRDYEPTMAERLARHLNNRVAANALVHAGIREITPFVVKRLAKLIKSTNVANVASGLYALGEIASHHQLEDPVYLNTQLAFLRLTRLLPELVQHKDPRVRRQAFIAARKFADENLRAEIWELVRVSGRIELLDESRDSLGEPPAPLAPGQNLAS